MEKKAILNVLKSNGVSEDHMKLFSEKLKDKKFSIDDCDKLLVKLGYEKLFSYEDEGSDDDEFDFDDFEPIQHRRSFDD